MVKPITAYVGGFGHAYSYSLTEKTGDAPLSQLIAFCAGMVVSPDRKKLYMIANNKVFPVRIFPTFGPAETPIELETGIKMHSIINGADGDTMYVAYSKTSDLKTFILPIQISTHTKGEPISVPFSEAFCEWRMNLHLMALSADGQTIYYGACNNGQDASQRGIFAVSLANRTVEKVGGVGPNDEGIQSIVLTPNDSKAYVVTRGGYALYSFNLQTKESITVPEGTIYTNDPTTQCQFGQMAMTPDGNFLLVAYTGANQVMVIDPRLDTSTGSADVGEKPACIAITSDGTMACVGSLGGTGIGTQSLTWLNLVTGETTSISTNFAPGSIALDPICKPRVARPRPPRDQ